MSVMQVEKRETRETSEVVSSQVHPCPFLILKIFAKVTCSPCFYSPKRYEALKRDLAERFRAEREGYTNGKSEYIQAVTEKVRREQTLPNQTQ